MFEAKVKIPMVAFLKTPHGLAGIMISLFLAILIPGIIYTSDSPLLLLGIFLIIGLFAIGIVKPTWIVYFSLFSGGFALASFTNYQKSLLPTLGGINLDGLRLVGIVSVLGVVAAIKGYLLKKGSLLVYFCFLVVAFFTLFHSSAKLEGLRVLFKLTFPYLIFLVIIKSNIKKQNLLNIQKSISIGGLIIIAITLIVVVLGKGFFTLPGDIPRLRSTIGGASTFSFYIGLIGLYFYAKFIFEHRIKYLPIYLFSLLFCIFSITRIGIGAMLVATLALTLLGNKKSWVVLIVIASIFIVLVGPFRNRLFLHPKSISEIFTLSALHAINTNGRENIWKAVMPLFFKHPIVGVGLGSTGPFLMEKFQSVGVVHNEYLRMLVETGILGFTLFMFSYLFLFFRCFIIFRISEGRDRFLPALAISGLILYSIINITDNGIDYYAATAQYVWAYIGLCFLNFKLNNQERLERG